MNRSSALRLVVFFVLALAARSAGAEGLRLVGRMPSPPVQESSGLVPSGRVSGLFWTHNDSGDKPRLFAVRRDGSLVSPAGVLVLGARNVDWEDVARDDRGNLLVGDIGNNTGRRSRLEVYVVPEPLADATQSTARRLRFPYPGGRGFDAEALFWWRGSAWVVSKNWLGGPARAFRLDVREPGAENRLQPFGEYPFAGPVTAADASPDGRRVAVLTYSDLWVFEPPEDSDHPFAGPVRRLALSAGQCEAVCLDGDLVVVGNEAGELYEVQLQEIGSR